MKKDFFLKLRFKGIDDKINHLGRKFDKLPIIDGIINIDKYLSSDLKILWIMKEPYESDPKLKGGDWNLCSDFYNILDFNKIIRTPATKIELVVDYALLSKLSADEALKCLSKEVSEDLKNKALDCFRSTAVINIKKYSGGSTENKSEIDEAYKITKDILLEQIEVYNPDIIICGNTLSYFSKDINFRDGVEKEIGMGNNHYFCHDDRLYINVYHPSQRTISDYEYINKIIKAVSDWLENYRK